MENNNSQFNTFMKKSYKGYSESLLELYSNNVDGYKDEHMDYESWLDEMSWETICDYADLFAIELKEGSKDYTEVKG